MIKFFKQPIALFFSATFFAQHNRFLKTTLHLLAFPVVLFELNRTAFSAL